MCDSSVAVGQESVGVRVLSVWSGVVQFFGLGGQSHSLGQRIGLEWIHHWWDLMHIFL